MVRNVAQDRRSLKAQQKKTKAKNTLQHSQHSPPEQHSPLEVRRKTRHDDGEGDACEEDVEVEEVEVAVVRGGGGGHEECERVLEPDRQEVLVEEKGRGNGRERSRTVLLV